MPHEDSAARELVNKMQMDSKLKKASKRKGTKNAGAEVKGGTPVKEKKNKKRAREAVESEAKDVDDCKRQKRLPTLSVAVAASVIDNVQSAELATLVAGQIARTAAIFNVDEVVVIDEAPGPSGRVGKGAAFLARVLQFMETPQYLRKVLCPMHRDLRLAGQLPPLDAPHHMRATEWRRFREGVVVRSATGAGSLLDVGLDKVAFVPEALKQAVRVTLEMGEQARPHRVESGPLGRGIDALAGSVVLPSDPRAKSGVYWGYTVRIASGLSAVFSDCPYEGGYDLKLGTSERGSVQSAAQLQLPPHQHALIAFGGPLGLEDCLKRDPGTAVEEAQELFDRWLNTCPGQGSRTIRTEEALLISLAYFQPALQSALDGPAAIGTETHA